MYVGYHDANNVSNVKLKKRLKNLICHFVFQNMRSDGYHEKMIGRTYFGGDQVTQINLVLYNAVPATAGHLGKRPPALAGHFCNVPTTVFAVLMSPYPVATCHKGSLSLHAGGGRSWQVLLYHQMAIPA